MSLSQQDRTLLRDLARQVAEAARQPVMDERRALWKRHNRLDPARPMILVFPEGAWEELLPEAALECEDPAARTDEADFRRRLFYRDRLLDDTVIEGIYVVSKAISDTGWGLEPKYVPSTAARGAWAFDPVVNTAADLDKLCKPVVSHDEAATAQRLERAQDLYGDILEVQLAGVQHISFHMVAIYAVLRGLEQVMWDMCQEPEMLHDAMSRLEAGYRGMVEQYEAMNLLDLNNDGTYHSSGGVGYTDELPADGYDPGHVRTCDMWASAEAQELAQVGPEMHEEFSLQYERRLLAPFGLNGYGCCEDLTQKLDDVLAIPNIRRISISPFSDVAPCAERLGKDYILSWKPHPAHLVGDFAPDHVRAYIRNALEASRGCVVEMILKDTHTCEHHPERFTEWTRIARELVEEFAA